MASPYAFVTLLTSDSYLPGVLTLAAALKDIHPSPPVPPEVDFQTVCLVTPETVDIASIKLLRKTFDLVVGVEIIEEDNERGLQLLGEYPVAYVFYRSFRYPYYTSSMGVTYSEPVICPQFEQKFLSTATTCSVWRSYPSSLPPTLCILPRYFFTPTTCLLTTAPHRSPRSFYGPHETSYFPSHSVFKNNFSGCRCSSNSSTLSPFFSPS